MGPLTSAQNIAMCVRITDDRLLAISRYVVIYNFISILGLHKNWSYSILLFCLIKIN